MGMLHKMINHFLKIFEMLRLMEKTGGLVRLSVKTMKKRTLLCWLLILCLVVSSVSAGQRSDWLEALPAKISTFREKLAIADAMNTPDELARKWKYVSFLREALSELNKRVGNGKIFTLTQLTSIEDYAVVRAIVDKGYIVSTFRGSSGFEKTEVDTKIDLLEELLGKAALNVSQYLSLYDESEKDWNQEKATVWMRRYENVVGRPKQTQQDTHTIKP